MLMMIDSKKGNFWLCDFNELNEFFGLIKTVLESDRTNTEWIEIQFKYDHKTHAGHDLVRKVLIYLLKINLD